MPAEITLYIGAVSSHVLLRVMYLSGSGRYHQREAPLLIFVILQDSAKRTAEDVTGIIQSVVSNGDSNVALVLSKSIPRRIYPSLIWSLFCYNLKQLVVLTAEPTTWHVFSSSFIGSAGLPDGIVNFYWLLIVEYNILLVERTPLVIILSFIAMLLKHYSHKHFKI